MSGGGNVSIIAPMLKPLSCMHASLRISAMQRKASHVSMPVSTMKRLSTVGSGDKGPWKVLGDGLLKMLKSADGVGKY